MFMGVRSHHSAGRVTDYASAQRALEKAKFTPTGRERKPSEQGGYRLGLTKRGQTQVIPYADGSIAFRLYQTDVVTWHEGDEFTIENFGTVTTSGFASQFLPAGIYLRHPVSRRGGEEFGDKGISYRPPSADGWKDQRIWFGSAVRFVPDGDGYVPDESTCDRVDFPELDRSVARELAKRFHLKDFEAYLSMAPVHMRIEHQCWDPIDCLDALEARDFRKAVEHMPTIRATSAWGNYDIPGLPVVMRRGDERISMGCIGKLKLAIWEQEGALSKVSFTTLGRHEYERRMQRVKQMDALGLYSGYGPNA